LLLAEDADFLVLAALREAEEVALEDYFIHLECHLVEDLLLLQWVMEHLQMLQMETIVFLEAM
jgi:hypothetical protein